MKMLCISNVANRRYAKVIENNSGNVHQFIRSLQNSFLSFFLSFLTSFLLNQIDLKNFSKFPQPLNRE